MLSSCRRRRRPQTLDRGDDGADHRPRHGDLGQFERDGAGVTHDTRADLDQLELQAGQRPVCHRFGQPDMAEEDGEVVGQSMELEPDLVVPEPAAGQPRPADGILAFADVLLGGAATVVEPADPIGLYSDMRMTS